MSSNGSRDKVDEIKNLLDIVDVIERDVSLHKESNGMYTGATSPTSKSGASLKVDQKLQVFKNFATGEGGDVLDWIGYNAGSRDTRGSDFPEVLRIAAGLAGVELAEMTEEERDAAKEKADIHNLFTEAAEIYHTNLTPELYDYIFKKWGITKETVDRLKIGYATTGRDLKDLDKPILKKSGLVYVNGEMVGGELFTGRIIFPYWKNGKVVYFAGRETEETPRIEREKGMKYKKLLVHKEDREYISPSVQNSYFYGEDSLRGSDYCIITEGVADCIVMRQAGFPCISPVTVTFREADIPKLIKLTKGLKRVYICNDNEKNKTGLKGALSTAEEIEGAGIEARLIELPKPEGIDKIDIADYMKDHSPDDFRGLIESSVSLWAYKLNQQVIKDSSTSVERSRAFEDFIQNDLKKMTPYEWRLFVENDVTKKFILKRKDAEPIINRSFGIIINEYNKTSEQEGTEQKTKTDREPNTEYLSKTYSPDVLEKANEILNKYDAFEFILNTWSKLHAGDKNIGENLLCSVVCTQITNAKLGLHQKPSGEYGSGKSDAMINMVRLLPAHKCITGSMSSKALFYDDGLRTGTIIYTDDARLSEDIITTLRAITSDFQEPAIHMTLTRTKDGKMVTDKKTIPPRITLWMSSVGSMQDQQLESRFCFGDTDESADQDDRVNSKQKERVTSTYSFNEDPDVLTCRCIFDIIFKDTYKVYAPLFEAVEWNNKEHRRNFEKFMDLLQSVTLFNFRQREKAHGGIVANLDDYSRALKIYMGSAAKNATNLTGRELKVIEEIQRSPGKTINFTELLKKTGIKLTTLRYLIDGRNGKEGLLGKVAGLYELDSCETVGSDNCKTSTRTKVYKYDGDMFGITSKIYQTVAKINSDLAVKITNVFIANDSENTSINHNYHTTITNDVIVKNDSNRDNNNKKTSNITKDGDNIRAIEKNNYPQSEQDEKNNFSSDTLKSCDSCDFVIVDLKNNNDRHNEGKNENVIVEPENVIIGENITDLQSRKNLEGMRKDIKTFESTYLRTHGGIEGIEVFVGAFLKDFPGYCQLFKRQAIIFEAQKICKTTASI